MSSGPGEPGGSGLTLRTVLAATALLALVSGVAAAADLSLVRSRGGDLEDLSVEYAFEVLGEIGDHGDRIALVSSELAGETLRAVLVEDPRVLSTEPAGEIALAEADGTVLGSNAGDLVPNLLLRGTSAQDCVVRNLGEAVWLGFTEQLAAERIGLVAAQDLTRRCGEVTVAIVDTGVDERHPLLADALLEGYDFLLEQPGGSEWEALEREQRGRVEQSITAIVDQSITAIVDGHAHGLEVDQSITAIVDQSITAIVDDFELPRAFGHGTMTAGLVRLVAPGARILPVRAFDGDGRGRLFDVVRAIRWAADEGADVINLSFSLSSPSAELAAAIEYASARGAVCVAAAGNRGTSDLVFPAALGKVWGVGATTNDDQRAPFSSFGEKLVRLAAPGEGVVSLYPGGLFAAGWGTSFSAPLVSGSIALLLGERGVGSEIKRGAVLDALRDKARALSVGGVLGTGRLDVGSAAHKLLGKPPPASGDEADSDG